jgi:uncharacterized protein (DUF2147 family)
MLQFIDLRTFGIFNCTTKFLIPVFILFLSFPTFSQNQIVGKWMSEEKDAITEIYENQGKYFGKITWLKNPNDAKGVPIKDTENPDPALKTQPLLNLLILKNFYFQDNKWKGGTIYDPQSGRIYTCTLWQTDPKTLKVRGYWGVFYKTQTWILAQ